jgi:hypothetical protein
MHTVKQAHAFTNLKPFTQQDIELIMHIIICFGFQETQRLVYFTTQVFSKSDLRNLKNQQVDIHDRHP